MYEIRRQKRIWDYMKSPAFLVLALVVLFFAGRAALRVYGNAAASKADLAAVNAAHNEAVSREASLETEITKLQSDRGVEEELRDKYRVAKDGEKMVIIVDSGATATSDAPADSGGIWSKIRNFFGF